MLLWVVVCCYSRCQTECLIMGDAGLILFLLQARGLGLNMLQLSTLIFVAYRA